MALKNFSKIELKQNNKNYWKLYKLNGTEVIPFSEWCLFVQNKYKYTTRDKYAQVVAKFLDYLVEANIFEQSVTRIELKESIDNYKLLLHVGKSVTEPKLKKIAEELNFNKIAPASWANNISAINSFLKFVFEIEEDEREYWSIKHGVNIPIEFKEVLPELNRITILTKFQKEAIKQKSFLANVCRKVGEITVSAGIKVDINVKSNIDLKRLDFPAIELPKLLSNTSCYRDRAIYSLLAGTGIRSSEALSLKWDLIDIPNQKVFIEDPQSIYSSDQMTDLEKIKFKGRATSLTFFIPELRHIFFQALYEYQLKEAIFPCNHDYVFQYLVGQERGKPYYTVSRQGFIKEFKKTAKRANIKSPSFDKKYEWTPHSLRHFYGVYMLNYIPLENKFGFSIEEVQRMMGHKTVTVTQQYARKSIEYICTQLEYAEMAMDGKNITLKQFNEILAQKYLEKAQEFKELTND